jgi:hypothetical protein
LTALAQVEIKKGDGRIDVAIDGQPATSFFYGEGVLKPYLYPLRSASGVVVTRRFPMEQRANERRDHIHHRGVWFAHSDVNGVDFWNADPTYHDPKMGHIVVTKIDEAEGGRKSGRIVADLEWRSPDDKTLVKEHRTMTFYPGNPRFIDFDFQLTAPDRVMFNDEKDGVFGIRLASELEERQKDTPPGTPRTGVISGPNGCKTEAQCWGSRAKWMDDSGMIDGKKIGVAIFDSPENPRDPTYWHVRGYGLFAANIFGSKAFTKDPKNDGSMPLEAGKTLRFRYRVVIHDGDADEAHLADLYSAWAK